MGYNLLSKIYEKPQQFSKGPQYRSNSLLQVTPITQLPVMIKATTYHVINVQVEVNRQTKELKKVTVTLNGIIWFVKYTRVSDGTLLRYDPATDTYYFKVTTLKEVGVVLSSHREIQGTLSPS